MIALSYVSPEGEPIADPSQDLLKEIVFESGADYWGNSGEAYLGWVEYLNPGYRDLLDRPRLVFLCCEPYGFYFIFEHPQKPRIVTYDGSGEQPRVKYYS